MGRKRGSASANANAADPIASNPTSQLPEVDSGALTQRKFRYQSAYGVVLLAGAACGKNDYKAIWCEQEDDFLAEVTPDLFDSYQVKTRTPELGPWDTKKEGFLSAIRVFAELQRKYGASIRSFAFVSNTRLLDSASNTKVHRCPARVAKAVRSAATLAKLPMGYRKTLSAISVGAQCTEEEAFTVFKKLRFAQGPSEEAFVAELATNHLSHMAECKYASPPKVTRAASAAIYRLVEAASLASQDPSRHYACLDPKQLDAQLLAKRVRVEDLKTCVGDIVRPGVRYTPSVDLVLQKVSGQGLKRFVKKLERGDLGFYIDTLRTQTIMAEEVLLELAAREQDSEGDLAHLRALVKTECDYAHLNTSKPKAAFGKEMLKLVSKRLEDIATNSPDSACGQPKEVLIGLAGMLTEQCEVWWSTQFDLETKT